MVSGLLGLARAVVVTGLRRLSPLKPSRGPRRKARRDPVTTETALAVFARDGACLAPRLGGSMMDCAGRLRIEHVKREARMGRRGDLLGSLCQGHTEDGARAGYCWATDAVNRRAMREYLIGLEAS